MKTVLLQPYFGNFPVWMDLFLYSCSKNKEVDFVFFTDCRPTTIQESYSNISFKNISFQDYCNLVSKKLGIDFRPESPYKLCDLKPFLGIIHWEIISQYDCWGYCDIDLVFGDLTILLEKMKSFDLISTHTDRLSGHFTLMKTKSKFTRACFKIRNWKKKLMVQEHLCLDESALTKVVSGFMFYKDRVYAKFVRKRSSRIKNLYIKTTDFINSVIRDKRISYVEYYTTPLPDYSSRYIYEIQTGKVINYKNGTELPYLHFLFFKKTPYLDITDYWKDCFYHLQQGESLLNYKSVEINKKGIFGII